METWTLTTLTRLFAADPEPLGDVDVSVPDQGDVTVTARSETNPTAELSQI